MISSFTRFSFFIVKPFFPGFVFFFCTHGFRYISFWVYYFSSLFYYHPTIPPDHTHKYLNVFHRTHSNTHTNTDRNYEKREINKTENLCAENVRRGKRMCTFIHSQKTENIFFFSVSHWTLKDVFLFFFLVCVMFSHFYPFFIQFYVFASGVRY